MIDNCNNCMNIDFGNWECFECKKDNFRQKVPFVSPDDKRFFVRCANDLMSILVRHKEVVKNPYITISKDRLSEQELYSELQIALINNLPPELYDTAWGDEFIMKDKIIAFAKKFSKQNPLKE